MTDTYRLGLVWLVPVVTAGPHAPKQCALDMVHCLAAVGEKRVHEPAESVSI